MKLTQKMRVVYMQDGLMLGILQQSDGHLYVGDPSGNWVKTAKLEDLTERRGFTEVPTKTSLVKSIINKVVPLRRLNT